MNVLFFTYDFPYPITSGGKSRSYNLMKYGGSDIALHLFSFTRDGFKETYIKEVKKIGVKNIVTFRRKKVRDIRNLPFLVSPFSSIFKALYFDKKIEQQIVEYVKKNEIDTIHFESFYTAYYLSKKLSEMNITQIFGTQNLEFKIYEDYVKYVAPIVTKPFYYNELQKIKREEHAFFKLADISLAVTESESSYIAKVSGKKSYVIENGIDVDYFKFIPKKEIGKTILFVGNFTYFPNVDAINFFYETIFKKLQDEEIRLIVHGKNSSWLKCAKDTRVKTSEYVEDIRDLYKKADIFISPVRVGGGTNFKILEAMAVGLPVVAFSHRLEGLNVEHNKHLLFADSASDFEQALLKLLENDPIKDEIISNARLHIQRNFSWQTIGEKMNNIWKNPIKT